MFKFKPDHFRDLEEYRLATKIFALMSQHLLTAFVQPGRSMKNVIARNTIARTVVTIRSIVTLWDMKDYQGSWTLHRTILDRYFHLCDLGRSNSHEAFADWSFVQQFESQNRLRSDVRFSEATGHPDFTPTPEQKAKYHSMTKSKLKWKRPKPKDVAKSMGLDFLYHYCYDFASTQVHPMVGDGNEDFYTLTGLEPKPVFPSHITALHNSLLVGCLLVVEAMNQSDLLWRKLVFDFYSELMNHLSDGSKAYLIAFDTIVSQGPDYRLCEVAPSG